MPARPLYFIVRPGAKRQTASGIQVEPGPIVPLIAIDQLPDWMEIVGVPRELTVEQTVGLSNLGTVMKGSGTYDIRIHHEAVTRSGDLTSDDSTVHGHGHDVAGASSGTRSEPQKDTAHPKKARSPNRAVRSATSASQPLVQGNTNTAHPADRMRVHWDPAHVQVPGSPQAQHQGRHQHQHQPQSQQHVPQQQQHVSTTEVKTSSMPILESHQVKSDPKSATATAKAPPPPAPVPKQTSPPTQAPVATHSPEATPHADHANNLNPTSDKPATTYCRHWCHHGTCKFGVLCRHTHIMPSTLEGLEEVGLKEFPAWWTAALGLALMNSSGLDLGQYNNLNQPNFHCSLAASASKRKLKNVRGVLHYLNLGGFGNLNLGGPVGGMLPQYQHQQQQQTQTQTHPTQTHPAQTHGEMTPLDKAKHAKMSGHDVVSPAAKQGADRDKPVRLANGEDGAERVVQTVGQGPPVVQMVDKRQAALQREMEKNVVVPAHRDPQQLAFLGQRVTGHEVGVGLQPKAVCAENLKLVDV